MPRFDFRDKLGDDKKNDVILHAQAPLAIYELIEEKNFTIIHYIPSFHLFSLLKSNPLPYIR